MHVICIHQKVISCHDTVESETKRDHAILKIHVAEENVSQVSKYSAPFYSTNDTSNSTCK